MADQQHLDKLRLGAEAWNKWRREAHLARPDLTEADLTGANLTLANLTGANLIDADLTGADLTGTDLTRAILTGAILTQANLIRANLTETDLARADLTGTDLFGANLTLTNLIEARLTQANLTGANLARANLARADLTRANLTRASLVGADLTQANLVKANLARANLAGTRLGWTVFGDVNLSMVDGLDSVEQFGPSTIGIDTIYGSQGNIPEVFLRNAGVPDTFLTYMRSLIGQPFDFYSCFISYSTKDHAFAERLHADLQSKGVRCWFAPEDMKIGDEIRPRIDEAIRLYDKLLLVLSEHSVASTWVKKEVETAFEKEQQQQRLMLFPIRVDDTVMQTSQAWATDIRRMRHIGDFRNWKNHDDYKKALIRLLRDLKAETP